MRIQWQMTRPWDLAAVAGLVAAAILAVASDSPAWIRVPLGLLFVLAAPGYAFVAALFPERHRDSPDLDTTAPESPKKAKATPSAVGRRGLQPLERAALSLGLSIAIVPLLGLALNYTSWGIRLWPVLATLAVFTLACLGIAWRRRARLPADERLAFQYAYDSPPWSSRSGIDRALTAGLVAAVVFAVASLVYVLAVPRPAEAFTEFYILGPTGKASCYPATFHDGVYRVSDADAQAGCPLQSRNVTIGIVNHEGRDVAYTLRVVWTQEKRHADNTTEILAVREISSRLVELPSVPIDLTLNATFRPQHEETFALPQPPLNGTLRLSFQLYLGPAPSVTASQAMLDSPYRRLHLWIETATDASAA